MVGPLECPCLNVAEDLNVIIQRKAPQSSKAQIFLGISSSSSAYLLGNWEFFQIPCNELFRETSFKGRVSNLKV